MESENDSEQRKGQQFQLSGRFRLRSAGLTENAGWLQAQEHRAKGLAPSIKVKSTVKLIVTMTAYLFCFECFPFKSICENVSGAVCFCAMCTNVPVTSAEL